jgi:hypothetical protein
MIGNINLFDNRFNYNYKGFCSIINQLIDLCDYHYKKYNNLKFNIEDNQVEEIFEVSKFTINENYNVGSVFLNECFSGLINNEFNSHTECNLEDLINKNKILNSCMIFKNDFLNESENIKNTLLDTEYIGVQIRGTDKKDEIPTIPLENIFKHIDTGLNEFDGKIFLATDDFFYLENLIKRYGSEKIIYNTNNIISKNGEPIHFNNNRTILNRQVMTDVYILSKSKYFYYTFSNVSYLSLIMGVNNFNKTINLNKII